MSERKRLKVAVVGGGIGGLATAVALAHEGIAVHVFEKAEQFSRIGAGISFGPNACRLLDDLDLLAPLRRVGNMPPALRYVRWDDGSVIGESPLGAAAEEYFGAPLIRCERASMVDVLVAGAPPGSLQLDAPVAGVDQDDAGVELLLSSGERVRVDAVIGADGVRSLLRKQLMGADDPVDSGTIVYRSVIDRQLVREIGVDLGSAQYFWLGPGCHVVAGALSDETVDYNVSVESVQGAVESWTQTATREDVLRRLEGWHEPVRRLVAHGEEVLKSAVFVRRPLQQWAFGRVAMLGDAAHAMKPFDAQGAVQAVEDAVVLAGCLRGASADDVAARLRRYETIRMGRAEEIQRGSAGRGNLLNLPDGPEQEERDRRFREPAAEQPWGTRQQIWEHDVRESLSAAG